MFNFILDLVNSDEFDGLMRHGLSSIGGSLVASGVLSATDWQTISGGAAVLIAVVWSFASKKFIKAQAVKGVATNA